jgi:signal transduction histidine kinase
VVYAAAPLESATESAHALELGLAAAVPVLILLIATTTWWIVGRALRPVETIRREVDEISPSELGRRVPEPPTGDEIQRLAETMNMMLERLEHATLRQRSFVSDAAHELRSPIASIWAETEIAATHPSAIDPGATLARIGSTIQQMGTLVEDLLVLATSDEQGLSPAVDVDLDEIVVQHLETARATAPVRIDAPVIDAARIHGHRDHLRRVVANVVDNATRHAHSAVIVELRTHDRIAELTIVDDGPGVPLRLREYVFDRFARVDDARSRVRGGAGLGLAIARKVVEDHAGTIRIEAGDGPENAKSGTRVVIRLPIQSTGSTE